jgi:hypothetical protein
VQSGGQQDQGGEKRAWDGGAGSNGGNAGSGGNAGNGGFGGFGKWKKKGPAAGAPAPRIKQPTAGLELQLIARMLIKPKLAHQFDLTVAEEDQSALGSAARVAQYIRDHDGEMIHQAMVMEHFRETHDAYSISQASRLLTDVDLDQLDLDEEFESALQRLRVDYAMELKRAETMRRAKEMGLS